MVANLWEPYSPDANAPWDLRRVVHLHRIRGVTLIVLAQEVIAGGKGSVSVVVKEVALA